MMASLLASSDTCRARCRRYGAALAHISMTMQCCGSLWFTRDTGSPEFNAERGVVHLGLNSAVLWKDDAPVGIRYFTDESIDQETDAINTEEMPNLSNIFCWDHVCSPLLWNLQAELQAHTMETGRCVSGRPFSDGAGASLRSVGQSNEASPGCYMVELRGNNILRGRYLGCPSRSLTHAARTVSIADSIPDAS